MKDIKAIISEHPFFEGFPSEQLEILADHATTALFEPGQMLFREGDVAWQFYIILGGRVAIECHSPRHGNLMIQEVGAGEVMGWSWLYQPYQWHFQARALEPTEAVLLDGSRLLIACEENHDLGYELMKRISHILIQRLESTRRRFLEADDKMAAA